MHLIKMSIEIIVDDLNDYTNKTTSLMLNLLYILLHQGSAALQVQSEINKNNEMTNQRMGRVLRAVAEQSIAGIEMCPIMTD
jgi:hypothetical protein